MKLCFIVDARSPIAQNWIRYFIAEGYDTYVISSYPCSPNVLPGAKLKVVPLIPVIPVLIKQDRDVSQNRTQRIDKQLIQAFLWEVKNGRLSFVSDFVFDWFVPMGVYRQSVAINRLLLEIRPDLVHAMRIPWEGVAAALATPDSIPLVISVWGNDFTLWANRNPLIARQTRMAVKRANALHSDCARDMRLARNWGFDRTLPQLVVPGAGGINLDTFSPDESDRSLREQYSIPDDCIVILNPRGIRSYLRNEVFFAALAEVVSKWDNIRVLCTGMQGNAVVERWVAQRNLQRWVKLLPTLPHERMVELYRIAQISVSPSEHDGTPNSLLEAMATGCFIVAGDIESIREWITDGHNGLLYNPSDKDALARSLILAIQDKELRERAKLTNRKIIEERANYSKTMQRVENFYNTVADGNAIN